MSTLMPNTAEGRSKGWLASQALRRQDAARVQGGKATLLVDDCGNFGPYNICAFKMLGYDPVTAGHKLNIMEVIAPEQRKAAARILCLRPHDCQGGSGRFTLVRKDGSRFQAMVSTEPLRSAGRAVGAIISLSC